MGAAHNVAAAHLECVGPYLPPNLRPLIISPQIFERGLLGDGSPRAAVASSRLCPLDNGRSGVGCKLDIVSVMGNWF
jgi:hypothetical protein